MQTSWGIHVGYFVKSCVAISLLWQNAYCSYDHEQLYKDLLRDNNKLIRPASDSTGLLNVSMGLKLTQLIDVDEVNQVITTSVMVVQKWNDNKMTWNPKRYGGITHIDIPCDKIWLPDIVLYNNADGNYQITIKTKVRIKFTGDIEWNPPAIYKSYCMIDVQYFPYFVFLQFGSWTYDGLSVNLLPVRGFVEDNKKIQIGMDLSEYKPSIEWDILEASANRHLVMYPCCKEPYLDITFTVIIRRKTLFYTINLIAPTIAISYLTIFVFFLPTNSGEKVTLCISILLSLTVFFLLLVEIIPQTSLTISLIGKYLLFTMCMVSFSIICSILISNFHLRTPYTHKMPRWMRRVFMEILPPILMINRPSLYNQEQSRLRASPSDYSTDTQFELEHLAENPSLDSYCDSEFSDCFLDQELIDKYGKLRGDIQRIVDGVNFIVENAHDNAEIEREVQDWKFVALVLDRLFLWIFLIACISGTYVIILNAPSLYETDESIPKLCSTPASRGSDDAWICLIQSRDD